MRPVHWVENRIACEGTYDEYLHSDAWAARRDDALRRADHRCQICNSDAEVHVHHRTYERIGAELSSDLTVLCAACHERHHYTTFDDIESRRDFGGFNKQDRFGRALHELFITSIQLHPLERAPWLDERYAPLWEFLAGIAVASDMRDTVDSWKRFAMHDARMCDPHARAR